MSGFGNKPVKKSKTKLINEDEYDKLVKKYKRIKKFMNSPLHELKRISGEDTIVEELIGEYENGLNQYYENNPEILEEDEEDYYEHYAQEDVNYHVGLHNFLSRKGHGHSYDGDNGKGGGLE